jgi:hypothetical protein
VAEHRLETRPFTARSSVPFGHVARFLGIEPEAEAEADLAFLRQHTGDQRLLSCLEAHRMHMREL